MNLGSDVWNLVCNGCTKTPPSSEELQNNNVALNDIFGNIRDSTLVKVMNYEIAKEVRDNLWVIHKGKTKEDCSSKPTGNHVSKENNDVSKDEYVMPDGVIDSKEHGLE